jgi:hypothetical protein
MKVGSHDIAQQALDVIGAQITLPALTHTVKDWLKSSIFAGIAPANEIAEPA